MPANKRRRSKNVKNVIPVLTMWASPYPPRSDVPLGFIEQPIMQIKELEVDRVRYDAWYDYIRRFTGKRWGKAVDYRVT